jgi:hypothetical protein
MASLRDRYEHRLAEYRHMSYNAWKTMMVRKGELAKIGISDACERYNLPTDGITASILWEWTSTIGRQKEFGAIVGFHNGNINKVSFILDDLEDKGFVLVR